MRPQVSDADEAGSLGRYERTTRLRTVRLETLASGVVLRRETTIEHVARLSPVSLMLAEMHLPCRFTQ